MGEKIYFGPQERAIEIFKPNAIQKALKFFGLWLKPNLSKKLNKTEKSYLTYNKSFHY